MTSTGAAPDWLTLQRRIFTRWINKTLKPRGIALQDCVKDMVTGHELVALVEVLSGQKCKYRLTAVPKMRVHRIDNFSHALKFAFESGVQMEIKPSAENFLDQSDRMMLAMYWSIMRSFLKFGAAGSEESKMNPMDGLRAWCTKQTEGYTGVRIRDFSFSWKDGLALCALIHRYRPKLIPWESLKDNEGEKNLTLALDVMEKHLGIERFCNAGDFKNLEDKATFLIVAELYSVLGSSAPNPGAPPERKTDAAAAPGDGKSSAEVAAAIWAAAAAASGVDTAAVAGAASAGNGSSSTLPAAPGGPSLVVASGSAGSGGSSQTGAGFAAGAGAGAGAGAAVGFTGGESKGSGADSKLSLRGLLQYSLRIEEHGKNRRLLALFGELDFKQAVIFVASPRRCDELARLLTESKVEAAAVWAAMSQSEQLDRIAPFREEGQPRVLVATDGVFEGGIDIEAVGVIINYDAPASAALYQSRAGRPEEKALAKGAARRTIVTLVATSQEAQTLEETQSRFDVKIDEYPTKAA